MLRNFISAPAKMSSLSQRERNRTPRLANQVSRAYVTCCRIRAKKIGGKLGDKFQRCPGPGRSKLQEKGNSTPGRPESHGRVSGRQPRRAGGDCTPETASRSQRDGRR